MTEKIALLVDSGSDVPLALVEQSPNIRIVPLILTVEGKEYLDRETIQPDEFYDQLTKWSELPKTASPTPGSILTKIQELKAEGYTHIIGITVSSGLSGTYHSFVQMSQEVEDLKMTVIDTKSVGIGSGLFAVAAQEGIEAGDSFEQIIQRLEKAVDPSSVYFYIPSLKYLRAGGRIGKVAGLVGSVMQIKPIIACDSEGIYYPVAKARNEGKAIQKLISLVEADLEKGGDTIRLGIAEGANQELYAKLIAYMKENHPEINIFTGNISPALGVHTGPGLVGIGVFRTQD